MPTQTRSASRAALQAEQPKDEFTVIVTDACNQKTVTYEATLDERWDIFYILLHKSYGTNQWK
jgi:hypothetical protein